MRVSNKYILNKRKKEELEASVIAQIAFDELKDNAPEIMGKPVICYSCGAAVINPEEIKKEEPVGLYFKCEFCDSVNKIDEREFNLLKDIRKNVIEYFEEGTEKKSAEKTVACIDISGSMRGKPLEGVKQSLIDTLNDLSVNAPHTSFGLITFTDWISLYNSGGYEIAKIEGKDLYDKDVIKSTFEECSREMEKISESCDRWIEFIKSLTAVARTALGPAVLGGTYLLKKDGRIIVLTDGLANHGIGNLQKSPVSGKKGDFYKELGSICRDNGIIIEIIGVATSKFSKFELEVIGEMANLTGGDIYLVDLSEIRETFGVLSRTDVLGRNVRIKMFTPRSIELKDITGDVVFKKKNQLFEANVGSVNPDRKICLSLEASEDLPVDRKIPIQIQIDYRDLKGIRRKRVYQDNITVTDKEENIIENFDSEVADIFYKQKSAELGRKGKEEQGIKTLRRYTEDLARYGSKASKKMKERLATSSLGMSEELDDMVELQRLPSKDLKYSEYRSRAVYGKKSAARAEDRKTRIDSNIDLG